MGKQIFGFPLPAGTDKFWLAPKKSKKISLNEFLGDSSKFFQSCLVVPNILWQH